MATDYGDDDGFATYVVDTVDPSYYLIVATAAVCVLTNLMLPFLVTFGRKRQMRRRKANNETLVDEAEDDENGEHKDVGIEVPLQEAALPTGGGSVLGGNSALGSSAVGSKAASRVSTRSRASRRGQGPKLTQDALSKYVHLDHLYLQTLEAQRDEEQESQAAYSDALSRATHRTTKSKVSAITGTVLDGGYVPPARGRGRRGRGGVAGRRGMGGRRKAVEAEFLNSMRNLETHAPLIQPQQEQAAAERRDAQSEYAQSEVSGVSSLRPRSVPGGMHLRRPRHGKPLSVWRHSEYEDDVRPEDAPDSDPAGRVQQEPTPKLAVENLDCCGERAWWRPSTISQMWDDFLQLVEYDRDSKRLVTLAVPFSLTYIVTGIWELVIVAVIAHFIGTNAVAAYTITELFIGLSEELTGGVVETITVLCPHALGAENNLLAGQYVQISAVLFSISMIPIICIWLVFTDDLVLWFGFDQETADIAQSFANVFVFDNLVEGIMEAYTNFLYCLDLEKFVTVLAITEEFVSGTLIVLIVVFRDTSLGEVAIFEFLVGLLFSVIFIAYPVGKGWLNEYLKGMVGTIAFKNRAAVRTVIATAAPLCIGSFLAYGEWEVLTIFAAHLGPAETAAWGIMATLWETIESTSEGFADAGEIRTAYHLGCGRPEKAKTAGYKCIWISFCASCMLTSIVYIFGENLAVWFTSDPTLQRMLVDLLPLVGMGNITLTAGGVAWALVGAQGRYGLATALFACFSWSVTLPIAAVFTFGFNINLQGIATGVVIGYSFAGTALLYVLMTSDWDAISRKIVEENEEDSDDESSSSDEDEGYSVDQSSAASPAASPMSSRPSLQLN